MITHFKGNRSPALSDTIRVNGVAQDLTGMTAKLCMRGENSSTLKVNASASIPTPSNGGVVYSWQAADVDTVGRFMFFWSVTVSAGIIQDTPEQLITFMDHAPVSRALCTLEDVQAYVPGYIAYSDLSTDTILMEIISAQSTEIQNNTNREFQPIATNPSAKVFDLSLFDAMERRLFIGDLANSTGLTVSITDKTGTAVGGTLTYGSTSALVLEPRNRQEWEPFNYIRFADGFTDSPTLAEGHVVTVTGNWGFPIIPADIRTACVKLVINRYLRDVALGGTAFADALTNADYNLSAAFASAQDTLESYGYAIIA